MLNTAVLFIIFNRPETTRQVFAAIREAKPKQLFIAADGPRREKDEEKERCAEVRAIATEVNWDCEVKTLFRDENLGCGRGTAEAISWFFDHVEQGIILEDDCLPSQSFFPFCEELLEHYKDEKNIHIISGSNQLIKYSKTHFSYLFSKNAGIWGWATWKRAWEKYDYNISNWDLECHKKKVHDYFEISAQRQHFETAFEQTYHKSNVSWWDYQWYYTRIIYDGIGIIPTKNLISNIGFGQDATHTFNKKAWEAKLQLFELQWPLKHPLTIVVDNIFDTLVFAKANSRTNKYKQLFKNFITKVLKA